MRVSFELKIFALDIEEAKIQVKTKISNFLNISVEDIPEKVDLELKISLPKESDFSDYEIKKDENLYLVTGYGTVKQSIARPIF